MASSKTEKPAGDGRGLSESVFLAENDPENDRLLFQRQADRLASRFYLTPAFAGVVAALYFAREAA
jgi:hypothetical protein